MALIDTAKEFISVRNAKIAIALRRDLLDRVFRRTRDAGFQEEKYDGLCLRLIWTRNQILEILNRRVVRLVKRRYTNQPVGYADLLPTEHRGKDIGTYIYSIADRPRDVIAFFNTCIRVAVDKNRLSSTDLGKAVAEYSRKRLRALADEWHSDYPLLLDFARILRSRPPSFKLAIVQDLEIEELCLDLVARNPSATDALSLQAASLVDSTTDIDEFRRHLFQAFYRTGLVGLKTSPDTSASWADDAEEAVTFGQINPNTTVVIAPKYTQALGMNP